MLPLQTRLRLPVMAKCSTRILTIVITPISLIVNLGANSPIKVPALMGHDLTQHSPTGRSHIRVSLSREILLVEG